MKSALVFLLALTLFPAATSADEKRLSVYSSVARYSLPVIDRAGHEYVGLLELLEPLGRVSAEKNGPRWKLRYNAINSEFVPGNSRAIIEGRYFDFPLPFLFENSRGLVPVRSLSTLLPRFLGTPVNFRESARRLFIGDVAIQSSILLDPSAPPRLVFNFTAPVNPTISTEPGKLHMLFKRDPVVPPGGQSISFDNKVITQVGYSESNGAVELDVSANAPLMASFSNSGRTITVVAVQVSPTAGAGPSPPASPSVPTPPNPAQPTPAGPIAPAPSGGTSHRVLAVVDAAHGGNERGAALTDTLAEKDITLGFARLLRHELEQHGFSVVLLRDADINLTLDQRAGAANAARAGIYISLHAASQGTGARVYTALLPVEGENKGTFRAWNVAQAPALPVSRMVAGAIVSEMQKRQLPARESSASLRPLNNVLMPALAVELAPGPNGIADLPSANYQQQVAAAIADAVAPFRDRMGVQP
ncbi:MAG TPA: N-acetylmuramoyl-L-alanine amidase [Terriglobales bacterium]